MQQLKWFLKNWKRENRLQSSVCFVLFQRYLKHLGKQLNCYVDFQFDGFYWGILFVVYWFIQKWEYLLIRKRDSVVFLWLFFHHCCLLSRESYSVAGLDSKVKLISQLFSLSFFPAGVAQAKASTTTITFFLGTILQASSASNITWPHSSSTRWRYWVGQANAARCRQRSYRRERSARAIIPDGGGKPATAHSAISHSHSVANVLS